MPGWGRGLGWPQPGVVTVWWVCWLWGGQSRCLMPLLSTTFHRLAAPVPPWPANRTGSPAEDSEPEARPGVKVSVGATQLSRAVVLQDVEAPVVGVLAAPKMPWARLSEP